MARGKFEGAYDLFLLSQEDEWERHAQLSELIYRRTIFSKEDAPRDPDEFNLWLNVPGVEMPDAETKRRGDEVIEERKRLAAEAKSNGKQAKH